MSPAAPSLAVAPSAPSALHAVPAPAPEPAAGRVVGLLLAAALLPRVALLFLNENLYGDAVARTDLAERWAAAPHWISSYGDGAYQFGPLHIYAVGLLLKLGVARDLAGPLVSLLAAAATVPMLYGLTRRLFGWRAGVVAGLGFAAWGMHLQMSTTGGSEALALMLVVGALALFAEGVDEDRMGPLFFAAVVLNLACAVRYDAWLLPPLLALVLLLDPRDRVASITRGVFFGFVCLPFPLVWMQGNELAHGHPLFPMQDVEAYHRAWVADGLGRYGQLGFRAMGLGFWPGAALLTLSPLVAFFGMAGMRRAWRERRDVRWLVLAALVPTAYFTFRTVVLANFQPLARFTVAQLALLLPFVAYGFEGLVGGRSRGVQRAVAALAAVLAVLVPAGLAAFTYRNDTKPARSLMPVSPVSTNPVPVMDAARWVKANVAPAGGALVLDDDPEYMDLQVAHFSGLPEDRIARVRWKSFRKEYARLSPEALVRFEGGSLAKDPGVRLEEGGRVLVLDGATYERVAEPGAKVAVYRRR